MSEEEKAAETFEEFLNSFFYGSRTDLNFKFIKELGPRSAGPFFQELFAAIARAIDSGDWQPVEQTVFQWQVQNYNDTKGFEYAGGPFIKPQKPIDKTTVGLLTSSGHFVDGDAPAILGVDNISQDEVVCRIMELVKAPPILSAIPVDTPLEKLCLRHGGYDVTAALKDSGVAFPLAALRNLAAQNVIGNLYPTAWSFIGACSQIRIMKHEGPAWVNEMVQGGVEALLLVPVWPVCHVSVGHVARLAEEAGIATVVIAVNAFENRLRKMAAPRVLLTPFLMGRPLGKPGDFGTQQAILTQALSLLEKAERGGIVKKFAVGV